MLYIIPTPIGNLQDMTLRGIEMLKSASIIYAEDTRTSKKLLDHFSIQNEVRSFHAHNEHGVVDQLVEMMQRGHVIALISDAGTPGISDPGFLLARACHENDVPVTCLPGATAFVPALVSSGIPCDRFHFEGFLPHKKGRQTRLLFLAELPNTFVLYESPHRLKKCLDQLIEHCGEDRMACVCREISKMHEDVKRAPLSELKAHYAPVEKVKGEIVIVVAGK
jgi:16S rRNA (cytidine1402-2'-O)-methyltransferase